MVATPVAYRARLADVAVVPQLFDGGMRGGAAAAGAQIFTAGMFGNRVVTPQVFGARIAPAGMTVEIGPAGVAYPFDTCQVIGVSRTDGLTPDEWLWRVVSVAPPLPAGQNVTFIGSGNRVEYIAPATRTGCVITIEAVGRKAGFADSVDTVAQTITAHGWEWTGPSLSVAVRGPQIAGAAPPAAAGALSDTLTDTL